MLLVRAWLRLGQGVRVWGLEARKAILQAVVAWGLPMMFTVPLFSRDVYAYIGQGRLMVEGMNPYENGISALPNYFQLGADKMWTEAPVPYGQLFLWIEQFVVWVTNVQPEACIMLFRLVAAVCTAASWSMLFHLLAIARVARSSLLELQQLAQTLLCHLRRSLAASLFHHLPHKEFYCIGVFRQVIHHFLIGGNYLFGNFSDHTCIGNQR